ncbi:elongation factor 1-alpha [Acidianus sulfidivorans JP7]|uniref:Elongation factor 1-alpha n=1 Tax=Acidianus sulfidivorans JP7 TaxID=619593 RepID=A0A2U9IKT4_9CREN|nr:GTP-binding protein [Acidianus sulfidivorans]AWR96620.1 elongation factor 1-alpha [Acidianus sulfidivorans JP7]
MKLPRENDIGKIEYKLILSDVSEERLQELATQMKFRIEEGGGEAIYIVGVDDDGEVIGLSKEDLENTIAELEKIARIINAEIVHKRIVEIKKGKFVAELLIRIHRSDMPIQVNIAVMGHVNAGKSTITGSLVLGKLDDGNGSLRASIARYLHEVISGRTSSITLRILGFDNQGKIVNHYCRDPLDEAEVTLKSSKILRLIDLGGHERYLRTTLKGLMGYETDYVMLVVGSDDGLSIMGKEHLAVASVLKYPIFIIITKIDKFPEDRINEIINDIKNVLKIPGINRLVMEVENEDDILNAILGLQTLRIVPVFKVSNVTGKNIDLLSKFLYMLPPRKTISQEKDPLVYIDEIYNVSGVGPVVLGSVVRGNIKANDTVFIGPSDDGEFLKAKIKSIQINRVFVDEVKQGSIATFAIQGIDKEKLRKGMVISASKPVASRLFKAKVIVLHHPTTIKEGYVATIHLYTVRQAARFEKIEKGLLRTGDSSEVELEFLYRPEYIEKGQIFVFREGRTRGLGIISSVES